MTLRLDDDDEQALALLSQAEGVSKHEAVLRAIHDRAARLAHEQRVDDASARMRAQWGDVLDRLGRA